MLLTKIVASPLVYIDGVLAVTLEALGINYYVSVVFNIFSFMSRMD